MPQFFCRCHPWDLETEGLVDAVGCLSGEIGVDGVTLDAVAAEVRELRPRRVGFGTATVALEAAVQFQPDGSGYVGTRLRPVVAGWVKGRNPFQKIVEEVKHAGLVPRARLSVCRNATQAARHASTACVNVLGVVDSEWLCPSNPDVREYVVALTSDLAANYPLDALVLANLGFSDGSSLRPYLAQGVCPSEAQRVLWNWCFCSSCRQRAADAGVDVEHAVSVVRGHLEKMLHLESGSVLSIVEALERDQALAAYHLLRAESVRSLWRLVRSRVSPRLVHELRVTALDDGEAAWSEEVADAIILAGSAAGLKERDGYFEDLFHRVGRARPVEIVQPMCPPEVTDGPSLVAGIHTLAQSGFTVVEFQGYGSAPQNCLDWTRQAIRYARREATT